MNPFPPYLVLLFVSLLFLPLPATGQEKKAGPAWEHLALTSDGDGDVSDPELAARIVRLGADGWELVTVLNFAKDGTTTKTVYYFKRPKKD